MNDGIGWKIKVPRPPDISLALLRIISRRTGPHALGGCLFFGGCFFGVGQRHRTRKRGLKRKC